MAQVLRSLRLPLPDATILARCRSDHAADDDSKEGLPVAIIAEEMKSDVGDGRLHPLAIIIDDAMWAIIEQPKGTYEIVTQSGKVEKVKDTGFDS